MLHVAHFTINVNGLYATKTAQNLRTSASIKQAVPTIIEK